MVLIKWDRGLLVDEFLTAMWFEKVVEMYFWEIISKYCWAQYICGMIWFWFSTTNDYYVPPIHDRCYIILFKTSIFISSIMKVLLWWELLWKVFMHHENYLSKITYLHRDLLRLCLTPFYSSILGILS
jgi:hypothetical protein